MIVYKVMAYTVLAGGTSVTGYFLDIPALVEKKFVETKNLSDSISDIVPNAMKEQKKEIESDIKQTKAKILEQNTKIEESNKKIKQLFARVKNFKHLYNDEDEQKITSAADLSRSIRKNKAKVQQIQRNIAKLEKEKKTATWFSYALKQISISSYKGEEMMITSAIEKNKAIQVQLQKDVDELNKHEASKTSLINDLITQEDLLE